MKKYKKILVTGGAGFIGSHIVNDLIKAKYQVVVFDNLSTGHKELVNPGAKIIVGDLLNSRAICQAVKGCQAVVHLAADSIVPVGVKKPRHNFEQNVIGGINLLEAVRKNKIKKIIFSSSASVYGEPRQIPIKEDDLKNPTHIYGASKLAVEKLLSAYYHSYGLANISLRYFNAYGPNERHNPETHAVPLFIQAVMKQRPLIIYGDGGQIRDYVYVKDISRAHILALESEIDFGQFNIGLKKGVATIDLVKTIFKVMGQKTEIIYRPTRPGDVQKLVADISKIKKALGWHPKYSLEQGLKETVEWFESPSNAFDRRP